MSRRRHDRWLLIRLAAQNVGRRRLRAIFLGVAVMLGVGIGFASFVAGWALRDGMARSFSRMGADLLVVPRATLVNITASLLTVQPTDETLPADLALRIAAIAGVAQVAPQRIVPALVEGHNVNLIAFDTAQDFSVQSWVEARQAGPLEGLMTRPEHIRVMNNDQVEVERFVRSVSRAAKQGVAGRASMSPSFPPALR